MNQPFTVVDAATGQVAYSGTTADPTAHEAPGLVVLPEAAPPNTYRAGDSWVPIPARPSPTHTWDWSTHTWTDPRTEAQKLADQWAKVDAQRKALLAATDWTVTRAVERGEPVPTPWSTYRQALRDIDTQPDPFNITWPVPPA